MIGAGALILARVLERSGLAEVVISESDIVHGMGWSLIDEAGFGG